MTNWIAWWRCLIPLRKPGIGFLLLVVWNAAQVQQLYAADPAAESPPSLYQAADQPVLNQTDTVPEPRRVMLRSATIPGWGQLTNKQAWKIPIVYAALAGITYYSISLHDNYTDYRAAFYNTHSDDQRFGPTPPGIDPDASPQFLRTQRDFYRNRRDFAFLGIFLAYGLNIADAYVFAQFRDFDVSDDLSGRIGFQPEWTPDQTPYVSLSFRLSIR